MSRSFKSIEFRISHGVRIHRELLRGSIFDEEDVPGLKLDFITPNLFEIMIFYSTS